MTSVNAQHYAQQQILQCLVDGCLVEGLLEGLDAQWSIVGDDEKALTGLFGGFTRDPAQRLWRWPAKPGWHVAMLLQPGITQAWEKVPQTPVVLVDHAAGQHHALSPEAFMHYLFANGGGDDAALTQGQEVFLQALSDTLWQATSSVKHQVRTADLPTLATADHFAVMEQWASLLDRPYHPTAKAKQGLNNQEYHAYMAEFNLPIELRWVAIDNNALLSGDGVNEETPLPVRWLASETSAGMLEQEMVERGLAHTHTALPVHPWQYEHALPRWLQDAFEAGACVSLTTVTEPWLATSSLRSLAPTTASPHFLKLPMAIHSLGASRYLPAVKMINGDLSARLLQQAKARDARLAQGLYLCDESKWWAYMPQGATLFDEAPRHLSAMVRSYPSELLEDDTVRLVPMATLGTPLPGGEHHVFDDWLAEREWPASASSVTALFGELCDRFFEINLRLFRLGMLAEVHGQNAVMVFKSGRCHGVLLRDHDSLRICVERLEQHGMQDPCYRIKQGHSNTLYHDSLQALLFWLQTLAIQVNLRAIIDALVGYYGVSAHTLWETLAIRLRAQLNEVAFDQHDRDRLLKQLFEQEQWPYKRLISPIIERAGGPGSMPFGTSATCNPLRQVIVSKQQRHQEAVTEH